LLLAGNFERAASLAVMMAVEEFECCFNTIQESYMRAHTLYAFFKDFAAPIATMVAAFVAAGITFFFTRAQTRIARIQADVAIEKLNFDLFEKRYALYVSARQLIEYLALQHEIEKVDHTKIRSIYVTLDEGRFFLPDAVRKYLDELHHASEEFLTVLGERLNLSTEDDTKWNSTAEKAAAALAKLREMYSQLPHKFEEALAFRQIKRD
jgi:hypothetical protein